MIARGLLIDTSTTSGSVVIESNKSDEPEWIAISASHVALIAARSNGVGVPTINAPGILYNDAVSQLAGFAVGPDIQIAPSPQPSPSTSPTPAGSSPSPSPTK